MPSVSSSSRPKVLLSSTVMTPSLPTVSIASAMSSPTVASAAEMVAVAAICSLVSTSLAWLLRTSDTDAVAASMPRLSAIGFAPAATLRRPSRTSACARTVAVVVPSPATSSVFLATSLTSSAPIFSYGSSSSISLAIETPSLVIVGAPHFFSRTTLRPFGPRVTRTASARMFMPRSRPRRASSSKAMVLAIRVVPPTRNVGGGPHDARDGRDRSPQLHVAADPTPRHTAHFCHSPRESANAIIGTLGVRVQTSGPPGEGVCRPRGSGVHGRCQRGGDPGGVLGGLLLRGVGRPRPEEAAEPVALGTRDDVHVQVRHGLAHDVVHRHERALCAERTDDGRGEALGGPEHRGVQLGREVEEGVDVSSRHEQDVTLEDRAAVEEGDEVRLVEHDVGRHLPRHDRAEDAVHGDRLPRRSRAVSLPAHARLEDVSR